MINDVSVKINKVPESIEEILKNSQDISVLLKCDPEKQLSKIKSENYGLKINQCILDKIQ